MANMTLRLDDQEELKLTSLMESLQESTKSKTIIKIINTHLIQKNDLSYYIEEARKSKYELEKLKALLRSRYEQEREIQEIILN
jgi:hypothetical protein